MVINEVHWNMLVNKVDGNMSADLSEIREKVNIANWRVHAAELMLKWVGPMENNESNDKEPCGHGHFSIPIKHVPGKMERCVVCSLETSI